jgi:hypothetical protein
LADKVPIEFLLGFFCNLLSLGACLLIAILPKVSSAKIQQIQNELMRVILCHDNKSDFLRVAIGRDGCGRYRLDDCLVSLAKLGQLTSQEFRDVEIVTKGSVSCLRSLW